MLLKHIKHIKTYTHDYQTLLPDILDEGMKRNSESNNLTSYLYNTLLNIEIPSSDATRREWEEKLGLKSSKDRWEKYLLYIHNCSINVRHILIQFKILHRLYYSKTKLNKIFSNVSPICDKCLLQEATITHSFASCIKLHNFWKGIFEIFSKH